MATIPKVQRTRIILDLVKDGAVASLSDYANVELASTALATKYSQAFWDSYPHDELFEVDGTTPRDPTNQELANHFINRLRVYINDVAMGRRLNIAGDTARSIEKAIVKAETDVELGTKESK